LEDARVVSAADGGALAEELGPAVDFAETSAKGDINVTQVFQGVARRARQRDRAQAEAQAAAAATRRSKKWACSLL